MRICLCLEPCDHLYAYRFTFCLFIQVILVDYCYSFTVAFHTPFFQIVFVCFSPELVLYFLLRISFGSFYACVYAADRGSDSIHPAEFIISAHIELFA